MKTNENSVHASNQQIRRCLHPCEPSAAAELQRSYPQFSLLAIEPLMNFGGASSADADVEDQETKINICTVSKCLL
jgi:hypothetical protein